MTQADFDAHLREWREKNEDALADEYDDEVSVEQAEALIAEAIWEEHHE